MPDPCSCCRQIRYWKVAVVAVVSAFIATAIIWTFLVNYARGTGVSIMGNAERIARLEREDFLPRREVATKEQLEEMMMILRREEALMTQLEIQQRRNTLAITEAERRDASSSGRRASDKR